MSTSKQNDAAPLDEAGADPVKEPASGFSRRRLLFGGVAAAAGAVAVVGADGFVAGREATARAEALEDAEQLRGGETIPFYGVHQAGIEMVPQAHQSLVAVTLRENIAREDVQRMLMILTEDAARLTQGTYALADSEPELSLRPARLTITFGFGRRLVDIVNPTARPDWLDSIPALKLDQLREEWNDGDLLLQIASDDPLTVAHAQRMLLKDTRTFGSLRWVQQGFRRAYGSEKPGRTQRNLLGQLDGTVNMSPGSDDFAGVVWKGPAANPAWLDGGTGFVVRRIEMLLDKWDRLDRSGREQAVGRRMDSGAPLTGTKEHDEPDFEARTPIGFPVIAEFAHIRRARSADPHERMFRRAYNYDQLPTGDEISNSGLIFTAYQYNVATQFTPVQRRLDELDLLNEWIVHIGSAVFAIPPGCEEGQFIGHTLFEA